MINRPNGRNVFPGNDSIDFSGADVTPANFLSVLRNLSDPDLNLLIYFADHGGPGILGFPTQYLYVSDLKEVILSMNYSSLFFMVEACEAGSMFDDWFPKNTSALVLTATDSIRPSFACYGDDTLKTYLGDCFSVNALQFLGHADTYIETLDLLTEVTKNETNTSPVSIYGDKILLNSPLAKYWGKHLGGVQVSLSIPTLYSNVNSNKPIVSWDVPQMIGFLTKDDSRFDKIRIDDRYNRVLYNRLNYLIRKEAGRLNIVLDNYTPPVSADCIKTCLNIILAQEIKLSEYSHRIAETVAILCDKTSENIARKLVDTAASKYIKYYN